MAAYGTAETGRTFVDVHQVAYAVAGAVVEVKSALPGRDPCQYIPVLARSTFQEHGTSQMLVA